MGIHVGEALLLIVPYFILAIGLFLSVGLTYAPCFASLCTEEFYPYETRLSVAIFYGMLASTACGLGLYAYNERVHGILSYHLIKRPIPWIGKRMSLGGLLLFCWITGLWASCAAFWWPATYNFYYAKAAAVNWTAVLPYLAVTNLTGHHCDILAGLLILPITRNSLIARAFKLHTSTLLFVHKFIAYCLLLSIFSHAIPYFAFLPQIAKERGSAKYDAFLLDNPNLSVPEAEARGYWTFAILAEGVLSLLIMLMMVITSLSKIRRTSYNLFYYCHVIGSVLFLALISFHASSDFYCIVPGLLLWAYDFAIRLIVLWRPKTEATLEDASDGWYRIRLPILSNQLVLEKARDHPLQTYYINIPAVSRLQNHAFTVNKIQTSVRGPEILFRKTEGKQQKALDREWTWKVAGLLPSDESKRAVDVRLEGPYVPAIETMFEATHVLCITGGTGITGAISLAQYWLNERKSDRSSRFRLVWTVRSAAAAQLKEVRALEEEVSKVSNMSLVIHVSSDQGRLDPRGYVEGFFNQPSPAEKSESDCATESKVQNQGWVYCSGPDGLLDAAEAACVDYRHHLSKNSSAVIGTMSYYMARWQV